MQQFLEAATLALQAIWANKLRSLLTVLGNIVAVTSIIAVVSLVQGLNASVKDAIQSELGADTFAVQRRGPTRTDEEEERAREQPAGHDGRSRRRCGRSARASSSSWPRRAAAAQAKYRSETLDSIQIRGVTKEYVMLPTTDVERGRPITPSEFDAGRQVAMLGCDTADRLFGTIDPIDKTITLAGVHFRVVGVAEKKGAIFGQSQDEFAVIPLEAFQRIFGSRQSLQLTVVPSDPSVVNAAMDDATLAMRIQRRLRPKEPDNFGVLSSETIPQHLQPGDVRRFSPS